MPARVLGFASLLLILGSVYGTFFIARPDRVQGDAARIVYFHVPIAWVAFLAFFVVFVASIIYLRSRSLFWDRLGRASGEVGVIYTTLALVTGSIWGYPIWGTWWTWDPKLTTTLILWFLYLGYLMVRSYAEPPRGPRYAAIIGIVGFVDVPIVYLSSYWWRTLHPQPVIGPLAEQQPSGSIVWVLMLSLLAFTVLYAYMVRLRMDVEQLAEARKPGPALRQRLSRMPTLDHNAAYVVAAFIATWLVLGGYLLYLRSRLKALRRLAGRGDQSARNVAAAAPRPSTAQAASSANGPTTS